MYKVMIVDDEDIARIGLQTLLDWEMYGFEVTYKASSGMEAIEIAQNEKPDLIISDVVMPIMDGVEMVKQLKKINYQGEIVIISNHNNLEAVKQLIRLGVEDYLLKISYKKEDFIAILNNVKKKLDCKNISRTNKISEVQNTIKDLYFDDTKDDCKIEKSSLFYIKILNPNFEKSITTVEKIKIIINENFKNNNNIECFMISDNEVISIIKDSAENVKYPNTELRISKMLELYSMLQSAVISVHDLCDINLLRVKVEECKRVSKNIFYGAVCGNIEKYKNVDITNYINSVQIVSHFIKKLEQFEVKQVEFDMQNILMNLKNSYVYPSQLLHFIETAMVVIQAQINQIYNVETDSTLIIKIKECVTIEQLFEIKDKFFENIYQCIEKNQNLEYQKDADETIQKVLHYINEHIHEKITLTDIAKSVNMHPNYLSSYFNKKLKCSIPKYINNLKLEYARKLLMNKNVLVKEASEKIGIYDVSYFSKLYKEKFGYYPSETENAK